jgi:3-hydroxyisobutyrate dehydrogenase-like beta-hydroxyacid dehydrogenase
MEKEIAFIGFGEAGIAFASDLPPTFTRPRAFDLKILDPCTRATKLIEAARAGVNICDGPQLALKGVESVISLVTADQALAAATAYSSLLEPHALWLDLNSVAPATKRTAAQAIEASGGRYADVAVMAPVHPRRRSTPLLVSGPHADAAIALLESLGFDDVRKVEGGIGAASAIKMIRSVMVKGMEALCAECVGAAYAAGVLDEVLSSLDASPAPTGWRERADYNLERMLVHGMRRAAEMEEARKTLDMLGVDAVMTRGTVSHQLRLGRLDVHPVPAGLEAKLDAMNHSLRKYAA